jgi:hypothetical protein
MMLMVNVVASELNNENSGNRSPEHSFVENIGYDGTRDVEELGLFEKQHARLTQRNSQRIHLLSRKHSAHRYSNTETQYRESRCAPRLPGRFELIS